MEFEEIREVRLPLPSVESTFATTAALLGGLKAVNESIIGLRRDIRVLASILGRINDDKGHDPPA